jgi:ribonuclease-3
VAGDLAALEAKLAYTFRDRSLLERALTHRSWAFENSTGARPALESNEQLEFLGDAVLGLLASELLVSRYPDLGEGRLSQFKARLVSANHLHDRARQLDLGTYLRLGRGEEVTGGRSKKTLLADALEAVIAAIYLDGGLEAARSFVLRHIVSGVDLEQVAERQDCKSLLQELAQARGLPAPRYRTVGAAGPDHLKVFTVEVSLGPGLSARAEGTSLKAAGQRAAEILVRRLSGLED